MLRAAAPNPAMFFDLQKERTLSLDSLTVSQLFYSPRRLYADEVLNFFAFQSQKDLISVKTAYYLAK